MNLTSEQSKAVAKAKKWYDALVHGDVHQSPVFRVFGYAGTGKTTIAKEFAGMIDGKVIFACYTGKAAHVLRSKGCHGAGTIHSLIYLPKSKSAQRLRDLQKEYVEQADADASQRILDGLQREILIEQENLKRPMFSLNAQSALEQAALLIVDEVSMVDKVMGQDLESFGIPILVLGDPAQLPPIRGGGYFTYHKPDVMLEEIHRQAAGSRVLRIATQVREGKGLNEEDHIAKGILDIAALAKFDQILVGTNKSRRVINTKMREHLGHQGNYPVPGDRLICTRNDGETGLLNGSQWIVMDVFYDGTIDILSMTISSVDEDGIVLKIDAHPHPFRGEEIPYWSMRDSQCFEYAYAMTVHKSQGSQFDTVCVIDESRCFPAHQRRAWLYTGITRASKEVTIIR